MRLYMVIEPISPDLAILLASEKVTITPENYSAFVEATYSEFTYCERAELVSMLIREYSTYDARTMQEIKETHDKLVFLVSKHKAINALNTFLNEVLVDYNNKCQNSK